MTEHGQPAFRTVMRGYDPTEVDRYVAQLSQIASSATGAADTASRQIAELTAAADAARAEAEQARAQAEQAQADADEARMEAAKRAPTPPPSTAAASYASLGERVGQILAMAEDEAEEMRTAAAREVKAQLADLEQSTEASRTKANQYSLDTRGAADQEAVRIVEEARGAAEKMLEDADREATARRHEAEAFHDEQRASAAKSATEFEQTLAERRDTAEATFQERVEQAEQQLSDAQNRVASVRAESEQMAAAAGQRAAALAAESEQKAEQIVADAVTRAEWIRAESEREIAVAVQRRDDINAHLTNVQQMLAALSGTTPGPDGADAADV